MLIQLNENTRITTIPANFILEQRREIKEGVHKGEFTWDTIGYYGNLEQLLSGMLRKGLQASECEGIQNIINEIKMAVKTIEEEIKILKR
jgi:hypothetical protein